ncbi:MAG: hypothetical protein LBU07_05480 [Coriobacteriales bacterium]|nr:hypothetical protein [Coriobacteriales bacterium]
MPTAKAVWRDRARRMVLVFCAFSLVLSLLPVTPLVAAQITSVSIDTASPKVGDVLEAVIEPEPADGTWDDYSFTWKVDGTAVDGTSGTGQDYRTYGVTRDDWGKTIGVEVTYDSDAPVSSIDTAVVGKGTGAVVAVPVCVIKTDTSVELKTPSLDNGQIIEFALSTLDSAPSDANDWYAGSDVEDPGDNIRYSSYTFTDLVRNTDYFFWARSKADAAYDAGQPSASSVTTEKTNLADSYLVFDPAEPSYEYNGSSQVPDISVRADDHTTLTVDTDYTIAYSNSTSESSDTTTAGTITVTATGKGNYEGQATGVYTIAKANQAKPSAIGLESEYIYGDGQTDTLSLVYAQPDVALQDLNSGAKIYGSTVPDSAEVTSAGVLTIQKVGAFQVWASQAGDMNFQDPVATGPTDTQGDQSGFGYYLSDKISVTYLHAGKNLSDLAKATDQGGIGLDNPLEADGIYLDIQTNIIWSSEKVVFRAPVGYKISHSNALNQPDGQGGWVDEFEYDVSEGVLQKYEHETIAFRMISTGCITQRYDMPAFGLDRQRPTTDFALTLERPWYSEFLFGLFGNTNISVVVIPDDGYGPAFDIAKLIDDKKIKVSLKGRSNGAPDEILADGSDAKPYGGIHLYRVSGAEKFEFFIAVPKSGSIDGVLHVEFSDVNGNTNSQDEVPTNTEMATGGATNYFLIEKTAPAGTIAIGQEGAQTVRVGSTDWFAKDDLIICNIRAADEDSGLYRARISLLDAEGIVLDSIEPDGQNRGAILSQTAASLGIGSTATAKTQQMTSWKVCIDTAGIDDASIAKGTFVLSLYLMDNAGNEIPAADVFRFKVDNQAPVVEAIKFTDTTNSVSLDRLNGALTVSAGVFATEYGYFFTRDTKVSATTTDKQVGSDAVGSGLASLVISAYDPDGRLVASSDQDSKDGIHELVLSSGFKGQIEVTATDFLYQETAADDPQQSRFVHIVKDHPYGSVLEGDKQWEKAAINIHPDETPYRDQNGRRLYNLAYKAGATITAIEPFAGIQSLHYVRTVPDDASLNITPLFSVTFNEEKLASGSEGGIYDYDVDAAGLLASGSLQTEHSLFTTINTRDAIAVAGARPANASEGVELSNITLTLDMTSMSMRQATQVREIISIDTLAPRLEYQWDNEDGANSRYYKATRRLTLAVTDRNFDAANSQPVTNGSFSGWQSKGDVHTATVNFEKDTDYTFALTVKDRAGHTSFYKGGATDSFVVDRTAPTIDVTFDNNSSAKQGYYLEGRTATVRIVEHNFGDGSPGLVLTTNGQAGNWASAETGDTHILTIGYLADGAYAFSIAYTDLAGNVAQAPAANESDAAFVVDTVAPGIDVNGVAALTAHNSDFVLPAVTFTDSGALLEGETTAGMLDISLAQTSIGAIASTVDTQFIDVAQGQTVNLDYHNLQTGRSGDGIYLIKIAATDNAGNEYAQELIYSINRWGSTWHTSDEVSVLTQQYYTNSPIDIEIHEINPTASRGRDVMLQLGDTGQKRLVEGTDFDVQSSGGSETWYEHVYSVQAANFSKDGSYSLAIATKDEPGNTSSLKTPKDDPLIEGDEALEIRFVVDQTLPTLSAQGIEDNGRYSSDTQVVRISVYDDTLNSISVYLDDAIVPAESFSANQVLANGGYVDFALASSDNLQNIHLVASDLAGNRQELSFGNVLVSTDFFVQLINNPLALAGAIIGSLAILALMTVLILLAATGKLAVMLRGRTAMAGRSDHE